MYPNFVCCPCHISVGYPISEVESKKAGKIAILSDNEIEKMRTVCKFGREVLDAAARAVKPGVSTDEIDRIVHEVRRLSM
jgi:methionyl aminopeptidase